MKLSGIQLKRDNRTLIATGDLILEPGKVTVLFGPSGSGKSTLLYALADLDPTIELSCDTGFNPLHEAQIGLVPQQSAVFEDLGTAGKNIAFAYDHAPQRHPDSLDTALTNLETKLKIDRAWRFPMSGGQKQRVALARALAGQASILLCDEPTSGLDPASRQDAIAAIHDAATEGVAVLVVTHDQEWNTPETADHAFILQNGTLQHHTPGVPLAKHPPSRSFTHNGGASSTLPAHNGEASSTSPLSAPAALLNTLLERVGATIWWYALLPAQIIRGLRQIHPKWFLTHLLHFGKLTLGLSSLIYLAAGGLLVGFSSTYFSVNALSIQPHAQELFQPLLLGGAGFGLYRVLIPLITALLVAAKTGSAITADIGSRQYGGQIAVMRTLDTPPESYLLFTAMLTLAIGMPLLNLLAFAAASFGSLLAFLRLTPDATPFTWHANFVAQLHQGGFFYSGTLWNILKLAISGTGVAIITYRFGVHPKASHTEIGRHISTASLWTTLWCLIVFFIFALFEFG